MRFTVIAPSKSLMPYIKHFAISENLQGHTYKVFPVTGPVMGFQYSGRLALVNGNAATNLSTAGISGLSDSYSTFKNVAGTGTVLVYFTEVGLAHFSACPAHELFNLSIAADNLFDKGKIARAEEKLAVAQTDAQRIKTVEQFLLSHLREIEKDRLVTHAVRLIYAANGAVKIKQLLQNLHISQSPFEKRFRKVVGTSPKKFAGIVRFNTVLNDLGTGKSLTEICYENNFFDQAHFIKDFKQFTGNTPENFKKQL